MNYHYRGKTECLLLVPDTHVSYEFLNHILKTMKTKSIYLEEINRLLGEYLQEIEKSDLKPLSAQVYQLQSKNFVRWIHGEFQPGGMKKGKNSANNS